MRRQAFVESGNNSKLVHRYTKATGLFQIHVALQDYNYHCGTSWTRKQMKNKYINKNVRDWYIDRYYSIYSEVHDKYTARVYTISSYSTGPNYVKLGIYNASYCQKIIPGSWDKFKKGKRLVYWRGVYGDLLCKEK